MRAGLTTILAVAAAVVTSTVPPALARPLEREHYEHSDGYTFDDCGFTVHNEVVATGLLMLRAPVREGQPPRWFDNYEVHETLTALGRTLHIDHQGLYQDLSAERVAGTVFRFSSIESGQPFVVRDEAGRVLVRDRGVLQSSFEIDTKGTTTLDDDELVEGSFQVTGDRGAHPAFYGLVDCEWLAGYFGA